MKSSRWLWLAMVCAASACNLYNPDLLDQAKGDDGSTGGSGGGSTDSGGTSGGGSPSGGGGAPGNGGTGGDGETGGAAGDGGGTGGGDTGGGGTGGGDTGGGGTGGSTGGTGGAPPSVLDLVDDLSSGQLIFSSDKFNGEWTRYAQTSGITWDPPDMEDAIVEDDEGNNVLHIKATFSVSDWGVDIVLPLFSGTPYDISDYDGIRFRAMREPGAPSTGLRLAIEDEASHRGSSLCTAGTGGSAGYQEPDCDNHAVRPALIPLPESWSEFNIPLSSISLTQGVSGAREEEFDPTLAYAIHFQMDPSGTNPVDFWLDDIYLYKF